ncbi:DUF6864 domain-containing function [Herbaspirillum huttiense]|uniref:Uncharacterized protein n=1 Tax=Herbaspirillum huttiense subsp. lycopersici TaxID=3074428 RepID=A0ABU2ERI0_9BURK|nr:hypothetical protein [Herbaspirillum huttiense]MDR9850776.1 hypothetical protein [Herbaspirillum huttiense SE1]
MPDPLTITSQIDDFVQIGMQILHFKDADSIRIKIESVEITVALVEDEGTSRFHGQPSEDKKSMRFVLYNHVQPAVCVFKPIKIGRIKGIDVFITYYLSTVGKSGARRLELCFFTKAE